MRRILRSNRADIYRRIEVDGESKTRVAMRYGVALKDIDDALRRYRSEHLEKPSRPARAASSQPVQVTGPAVPNPPPALTESALPSWSADPMSAARRAKLASLRKRLAKLDRERETRLSGSEEGTRAEANAKSKAARQRASAPKTKTTGKADAQRPLTKTPRRSDTKRTSGISEPRKDDASRTAAAWRDDMLTANFASRPPPIGGTDEGRTQEPAAREIAGVSGAPQADAEPIATVFPMPTLVKAARPHPEPDRSATEAPQSGPSQHKAQPEALFRKEKERPAEKPPVRTAEQRGTLLLVRSGQRPREIPVVRRSIASAAKTKTSPAGPTGTQPVAKLKSATLQLVQAYADWLQDRSQEKRRQVASCTRVLRQMLDQLDSSISFLKSP